MAIRRKNAVAEQEIDEAKVQRYIRYTRWVWFIGTAISIVACAIAVVGDPGTVAYVFAAVTVVQAALALPAAWFLPRRLPWARNVLYVLALLSAAGIYSALKMQAWPSLALNAFLVTSLVTVNDVHVKAAFELARRRTREAKLGQPAPVRSEI